MVSFRIINHPYAGPSDAKSDDPAVRGDVDIGEQADESIDEPKMWDVNLHNDDYTTKAFVVEVLREVFGRNAIEATAIMLRVHKNGRGVVGTYTYDVAQTKIARVHAMSKKREFPLRCSVSPAT